VRTFLKAITRHPLGLLGAAITTGSAATFFMFYGLESVGLIRSPYIGILAYLVVPAVFMVGLVLIPLGVLRARRRDRLAKERGEELPPFPIIDLNTHRTRKLVLFFLVLTIANLVILTTATFKGVEAMDSTEFCGETCHNVMAPEHTAYQNSPHARVKCASCHIGPGADWFVKSKLSGAWQVVATTFDLYPRPIPTPIKNLRPARETCEQCHWPTKFVGDRLKVITHHADDEKNTEFKTVLLLRVGGLEGRESHGIHWHVDPGNRIRYRADEKRETVYEVELTLPDGTVKRYLGPDAGDEEADAEGASDVWRTMDCVDCHNRPTHIYRTPEQGIDEALQQGRIDHSLPYVRREGLKALQREYESHEAGREGIRGALEAFYAESYPDVAGARAAEIDEAARVLGDVYAVNVFPEMKVTWGTYPDHIGHMNSPGCFRCHNDEHETEDGDVISQDCET